MAIQTPTSPVPPLTDYEDMQNTLPYWARSTNPIVRRHLGLYWRTVPPDLQPFTTIFLTWTVLMVIGMVFPPFFSFTMISFIASILIIPFALLMYGHILLTIAINAASMMQQEMNNNTFELLQATPMSLIQIFLGKTAAALWQRVDDIVMVAQIAAAFSPPIFFTIYSDIWSVSNEGAYIVPVISVLATVVAVYRVVVEPVMIGVIAVYIGLVVEGRSRAITSAVVIGTFYFLLLNLLRQLPVIRGFVTIEGVTIPANIPLVLLVDFVVPVILPPLIIVVLLKLSERTVSAD